MLRFMRRIMIISNGSLRFLLNWHNNKFSEERGERFLRIGLGATFKKYKTTIFINKIKLRSLMGLQLVLRKKPKGVTIIEGFPGIGLIGTIATEFLVAHQKTEQIGSIILQDSTPMIAIHEGKVIEPVSIHYNKEHNLVIIHAISAGQLSGWPLAEVVKELAQQVQAKEIVSVEGVGSAQPSAQSVVYYFSSNEKRKKDLVKIGKPLQEGIIVGVTGALLAGIEDSKIPITTFFGEAQSNLPDSKAAAQIIMALDKYLDLDVDPAPLLKQAQAFEEKLKKLIEQTRDTSDLQKKKTLSYFG